MKTLPEVPVSIWVTGDFVKAGYTGVFLYADTDAATKGEADLKDVAPDVIRVNNVVLVGSTGSTDESFATNVDKIVTCAGG